MNDFERKKTIWLVVIFSVLVTVVAWIAPLLGGSPTSPGLGFILWGTAPLLVSLIMRLVTRDWSDLGVKPAIRKNARWYLVSFLAFPVIIVLTLLIGALISVSSISEFSLGQYLQTALTAMPIFFIFAIFEEVGWRGYLAPKLASLGINSYIEAALVAVVWASWHLPYFRELSWVYTSENLMTFIPRFYLAMFAFSVVYGEIRIGTATFWPAVLMHSVNNSFGHPLAAEYVTVAAGMDYLGSVGNGLFVIAFMFLLGAAMNRRRLKKSNKMEGRMIHTHPLQNKTKLQGPQHRDDYIIDLRQVVKTYESPSQPFTALKDINLQLRGGEFIAVVGKSGSGKTTLLNLLAGIDRPTSGAISVAGTQLHSLSESRLAEWRGRTIGLVFQFFQLLPTLTVAENVMLPMDFAEIVPAAERRPRALKLLDRVGIRDQADKLPAALSGGEQQRAAIARALANDPPILLADEPTGNLDSATGTSVLELFANLNAEGRTIVVVTHERDVRRYISRQVILRDGRVADRADRLESAEVTS